MGAVPSSRECRLTLPCRCLAFCEYQEVGTACHVRASGGSPGLGEERWGSERVAGERILSGGVGVPGHVTPTSEKSGGGRRSVSLQLRPISIHGVNQKSIYT